MHNVTVTLGCNGPYGSWHARVSLRARRKEGSYSCTVCLALQGLVCTVGGDSIMSTNGHQYNSRNIETFVATVCYPHNISTRTCKTLRIPYSAKIPTASSLHFSTGSDSTFRRGFTRNSISPCNTSGEWAGLLPTVSRLRRSKALLLVVRLSSERQFTSRWSFWKWGKWNHAHGNTIQSISFILKYLSTHSTFVLLDASG